MLTIIMIMINKLLTISTRGVLKDNILLFPTPISRKICEALLYLFSNGYLSLEILRISAKINMSLAWNIL